ncbi:MAG TPA: hypothetical protein DC048_12800, partial [Planctomycetaceae bacterium]|nr:hypothetical protein [Planctomycetaceae bacterium]
QYKQPRSAIEIGSGTQLVTAGDVTIASEATANATGQAIWSVLADWLVKKAAGLQTQQGFGFAAGFSYADAAATALVAENAQITAGGRVAITTAVNSSAQMKSMVILNEGLQQTNPNNIEVAYAGATTKATSRVTVAAGATVAAQKNVDIHASATSATGVKPKTASYRDGMAGVTVGTGFTEGVVEVIVGGSIIAGQVSVPAPLTFNPALTVDFAGRSLIFPGDVGFRTGDEVIYSTGVGAAIPGLVDGTRYFAIVDPAQPTRLRLAASAADASAGRAIDLGAGYPTLTTAKGTLPIVSIDAGASDTLWFGFDRWPDGSPLFTTGDTVQYRALAGHSIGQTDAAGQLLGALPDGTYRVEVVPGNRGDVGLRIRLLDAHGGRVHLDTSPQFVTDSGAICRVDSFDADAATVTFIGAGGGGSAVPGQQVPLTNGQRIRYVQAFGMLVPGLVDGRDYYAVVDPAAPGVIQLAESEPQAQAANPAIQNAAPTLETQDADPARRRTIAIGDVQPGTGLVFGTDPQLPAGTPVTYRAVPGKPVDGLVDGVTYYAYPQVNPYFEPNFPQYVVGLRNAADPSAPLIEHQLLQSLSAGGTDFVINGIDASAGALSLALPQRAPAVSADSSQLVGGAAVIAAVPPGSPQLWTNATGGTFLISLPNGAARALTAPIPFSATASAVAQAINAVGIPGISVATAYGRGRSASPWTLVGSGLDDLVFDWTALNAGAAVWSRLAVDGLEAVSTTATGGTFTLTLDVAGTSRTTAPLRVGASATEVRSALNAIPGALAGMVTGSGTATDPWLIGSRVQPLRTGDAVVFRDAWGSASPGLLDGQTFYAVVAPIGEQGRDDSVVIRLAATRDAALVPNPSPVPLATTLAFEPAATQVMAGAGHTLTSRVAATGINLAVSLDSTDSQTAKSANGSAPDWLDVLTRGDYKLVAAISTLQDWKSSNSAAERTAEGRIRDKLGAQQANPWVTGSASTSYLKVNNTARVVVESTATLRTIGSVTITSGIVERLSSSVDATVSKPTEGTFAAAVAVDIVSVSNTSHATVESGARVTGGRGVTVHAQTAYPWAGAWLSPLRKGEWLSRSARDDVDDWTTALDVLAQTLENAAGVLGQGAWQNLLVS